MHCIFFDLGIIKLTLIIKERFRIVRMRRFSGDGIVAKCNENEKNDMKKLIA